MEEIRYFDAAAGAWRSERVFAERELRLLYGSPLRARLTARLLARGPFSSLYGLRQRSPQSRSRIEAFVRELGVDASEAARPLSSYPSLDAFFARRLRPGARPLEPDPRALLSACDARTLVFSTWELEVPLRIKGSQVTLTELTGDAALAQRFAGGGAVVFRLAPADYHRFHFPASGWAEPARRIAGPLHSVHPIALAAGAPSFRNKRAATLIQSESFGDLLMIEVGALSVGTIEQTYRPGRVARGDEKGTFHFGGSTVVLLSERGRVRYEPELLERSAAGAETLLRVGVRIGSQAS